MNMNVQLVANKYKPLTAGFGAWVWSSSRNQHKAWHGELHKVLILLCHNSLKKGKIIN